MIPAGKASAIDDQPGALWLWLARALALTALGLSGFLLALSLGRVGEVPGCGGGGTLDCEHVLTSRWSVWLGVPVSALAVVAYTLTLAMLLQVQPRRAPQDARGQQGVWLVLLALSVSIAGAALWYIGLQLLSLGSICTYCTAAHACGLLLAALLLVKMPHPLPRGRLAAGAGVLSLLVLIGGQWLVPPAEHRVQRIGTGADTDTGPGPGREIFILGGRVRVQPHGQPTLGSPDARHVLVYLYDYTCPHCRQMHAYLEQARQRYRGQIAIVLLPAPLDGACNEAIEETEPRHEGACELAKLALAVWKADPAPFQAMDRQLFAPETPPRPDAARQIAVELIGEAALQRALADPWIDRQIQINLGLYRLIGGVLPKVIAGGVLIESRPGRAEELFEVLEQELALGPEAGLPLPPSGREGNGRGG